MLLQVVDVASRAVPLRAREHDRAFDDRHDVRASAAVCDAPGTSRLAAASRCGWNSRAISSKHSRAAAERLVRIGERRAQVADKAPALALLAAGHHCDGVQPPEHRCQRIVIAGTAACRRSISSSTSGASPYAGQAPRSRDPLCRQSGGRTRPSSPPRRQELVQFRVVVAFQCEQPRRLREDPLARRRGPGLFNRRSSTSAK